MIAVRYPKRRVPWVIARLFLNLVVLAALGALVWYGYGLFSTHHSQAIAIRGATILIAGLVGWVFLTRFTIHFVKSDRPSIKLTILCLVSGALIFGFAGVEPIAGHLAQFSDIMAVWLTIVGIALVINPLYVIAVIALIIWIVYTIRHH
jgi:hypothetical protein